jgi:transcriptional regulator with XRE-family HTH domain
MAVRVLEDRAGAELRRKELAAFLRNRREGIRPEEVGLPPSRRRRTPGLRREEVAQLAGVGVTWYTWLEQGREISPSHEVLSAIARTLRFDAHEYEHLYALAGLPRTAVPNTCRRLPPTVQPLLDGLDPYPALVLNARFDILAQNRTHASFCRWLEDVPLEERNTLWLAFTNPGCRETMVDWRDSVGRMVAEYRAAMADYLDDPAWKSLVERLHHASPEFTEVWERHEVQGPQSYSKRVRHQELGLMTFDYTNLWLGHRLGERIVAFTPGDESTRLKLEALHRRLVA